MYVLKPFFTFSFIATPLKTFLYFLLLTFLVFFLFPYYAAQLFHGTLYSLFFALIVLGFLNPWIYRFIANEYGHIRNTTEAHPDLELLNLAPPFLFSKLGDVVFQQVVVGTLVLMLVGTLLPVWGIALLSAGIFCLGHLGLIFRIPREWAFYFLVSAAVGGVLLPLLILFVEGGFYYAISLHMLWYVATGAFYNGVKHKNEKRSRT